MLAWLPELTKSYVQQFAGWIWRPERRCLLRAMNLVNAAGNKKLRVRAVETLRKAVGTDKYFGVVENDGSPVVYVDVTVFKNWGKTVENTPAVYNLQTRLMCR